MDLHVRVVSQHPPGGRCTLYAGYAEVLAIYWTPALKSNSAPSGTPMVRAFLPCW